MVFDPLNPKVVLGIAAHPDDLDFGAGGTMAKFAQAGAAVYYLILTEGGNGTADRTMTAEKLTQLRQGEQRAAADIIGAKDVFFCDYPDGCLKNTKDARRDIVKVIRQVKPEVVITWDPSVLYSVQRGFINHPDHRASGQAALDAVFPLARDYMSFPELIEEGYEPHKTPSVLLMNFNTQNYYVDISDVFETKMKAIAAHTSQVKDVTLARPLLEQFAQDAAGASGMPGIRYAESFVRVDLVDI